MVTFTLNYSSLEGVPSDSYTRHNGVPHLRLAFLSVLPVNFYNARFRPPEAGKFSGA